MLYESTEEAGENKPLAQDSESPKSKNKAMLWTLENLDTGEKFESQFPPEKISTEFGTVYASGGALNKDEEITQWIRGKAQVLSVTGTLFSTSKDSPLVDRINILKKWTKRDPGLNRPPVLAFSIGQGWSTIDLPECLLENVGGVEFNSFRQEDGEPRSVTFTLDLREYFPFQFESPAEGETRWARAKEKDYYEKLCEREYGDPMLGDAIRKQYPDKPILSTGEIVKLPSASRMRGVVVQPESIPLFTGFGRKSTAQRTRRIEMFLSRSRIYTSHVVKE